MGHRTCPICESNPATRFRLFSRVNPWAEEITLMVPMCRPCSLLSVKVSLHKLEAHLNLQGPIHTAPMHYFETDEGEKMMIPEALTHPRDITHEP